MLGIFKKDYSQRQTVGVDLHSDGIAIAICTLKQSGEASQLQCDFLPATNEGDIGTALLGLVEKHQVHKKPTVILLSPDQYSILQTNSPPMSKAEMRAATRWKIGDLVPYSVEESVVDIFEYPESGQRGSERKLYTVAAKSSDVATVAKYAQTANLDLKIIDIEELALRNVVSQINTSQNGVIAIHFFENSGLLEFIQEKEVYITRRLDIGFTGLASESETVYDDVVLELQRSLDYFESHFRQPLPSEILIYPPDKIQVSFMEYLSSHLRLSVDFLSLESLTGYHLNCAKDSQSRCLLAIGAALREELEN